MRGSVDPKDAFFLEQSDSHPMPTDQYFLLVFDGPSSDDGADLADLIRARAARIPALCKVLKESPGGVDTPFWVADPRPSADGVIPMTPPPVRWSECLDRVTDLLAGSLDPHVRPWALHVAQGVVDCPSVEGSATVVLARINHAVTDGGGGAALMRALFARDPDDRDVNEADESRPRAGAVVTVLLALVGLLRRTVMVPLALARFVRGARRAGFGRSSDPGPVVFNGPTGRTRQLTVLPVPDDLGDGTEYTKTQLVLAAISVAMRRYVERRGEQRGDLLTQVTVRVRDGHRWHGANRFLPALISLAPDVDDAAERARLIADALRGERRRLDDPRVVAFYRFVEAVPVPLMRLLDRLGAPPDPEDSPIVAHTTLTSVDCGDGDLDLGGGRLRFISGFPPLSATIGLGHGLYGAGSTLTVGVLSSPESLPDPGEYASLLSDALDEVAALRG